MQRETLNIAQLIHFFQTGGLEQLALRLAQSYQEQGHQAHVIAYEDGPFRSKFEELGIQTHIVPRPPRPSLKFVGTLARFFLRNDFDVIHTHHVGPMLYGVPAARLCGLPVIHTTHSNEHLLSPQEIVKEAAATNYRRVFSYLAKSCQQIITVNQRLKQYLQENVKVKAPVTAIANGVDAKQFHGRHPVEPLAQELGWTDDRPRIGVIGRLEPEKGHRYLLSALAHLKRKVRLIVVGDGSLRHALEQQATEHGLAEQVQFLGIRHDLPQLFSAFDIVALPSLREGLPLVLLEALSSGVPIVASDVGSVANVLERSQAGIVVPPGDSDALASAIQKLLDNTDTQQNMKQRGQLWVHQHYSQDAMVQAYLDIIHECRKDASLPFWLRPFRKLLVSLESRNQKL